MERNKVPTIIGEAVSSGISSFLWRGFTWTFISGKGKHLREIPVELHDSVPIATNGYGDVMFATLKQAKQDARGVILWHDDQHVSDEGKLTSILFPRAIEEKAELVFYSDRNTRVLLGDAVEWRVLCVRGEGEIVYVPGLSVKDRRKEGYGDDEVAARTAKGGLIAFPINEGRVVSPMMRFRGRKCGSQ